MADSMPTSFRDLIQPSKEDNFVRGPKNIPPKPLLSFEPTANEHGATRFSANKEWTRPTHITVVPPPESHFYINEKDRFNNKTPFVDLEGKRVKEMHNQTIKNKIRSKTESHWWPTTTS